MTRMPTTFNEVMDFHRGNNLDVYKEIKSFLGQLLPFVGAGLTADVYSTWKGTLRALGGKLADPGTVDEINELIEHGELYDAAELIMERRTPFNFTKDLVNYLSAKKLDDKWDVVKRGPIWLLPDLFSCPVLTTNFDQAIETVYQRRGFSPYPVLDPTIPELRLHAVHLMYDPCVFKLHGTVVGTMMDTEKLVFTKAQYDRHYAPDGDVRKALRDFVDRRALLFLGCSLTKDATVDVLKEAVGPGVTHYAIVSCDPGEQDLRVAQLADAHIRAIVYEEGKYDSVRVVLEKLLEETDPAAYARLRLSTPATAP